MAPLSGFVRFGVVFTVFLILDQLVKAWTRSHFEVHQSPGFPWPGVFELTLTYNKGIAFGMMQGLGVLFAPIALIITGGAGYFCWNHPHESRITHFALGLLASGAVGNLIDRIWLGQVTDMFWFRLIQFPVFNLADTCITVAAVLLAVRFMLEPRAHPEPVVEPEFAKSESESN